MLGGGNTWWYVLIEPIVLATLGPPNLVVLQVASAEAEGHARAREALRRSVQISSRMRLGWSAK